MSMALCKTAVSPLLTHWRYCSLALSHRHHSLISILQSLSSSLPFHVICLIYSLQHVLLPVLQPERSGTARSVPGFSQNLVSQQHPFQFTHVFLYFAQTMSVSPLCNVTFTTFQNDWADMKLAMGKRDIAWFEFKIRFWQISHVAQGPCLWSWTTHTQKNTNHYL